MAMWNDRFIVRQSEHLAARLARISPKVEKQVAMLYQLSLDRAPTANEVRMLKSYAAKNGMANACRVILNSNEFMFVN